MNSVERGDCFLNYAVDCRPHPGEHRIQYAALDVFDKLSPIALESLPIEVLGHRAELHDEGPGEVFRLDLTALFAPGPNKSRFGL
jgi:hypothetical protein